MSKHLLRRVACSAVERLARQSVVAACLAAALALGLGATSAWAQPTVVAPANGASFPRSDSAIAFTVNLPALALGDDATIQLSTSSATNANGALANPDGLFFGIATGSPATYTWDTLDLFAAGTYYWQATSDVCGLEPDETFVCPGDEVSPVQSIVLTPLPPPAPVSPANGATQTVSAVTQFTFTPNGASNDTNLEVLFSRSSSVGVDGTLAHPASTVANLTDDLGTGPNSIVAVPIPVSLDVPGTIYWQPVRVNCYDDPTAPCNVAGAVSALTLKPPPPAPLRVTISGSTTIRIGKPRISWTIRCNETCSGTASVHATDGVFDLGPTRFAVGEGQQEALYHTYSGKTLAALADAVQRHGVVQLNVSVSAVSKIGGGSAHASRAVFVRPNPPPPPPPGPDAGLSFSGNGLQNLGPITVPVDSYLVWSCSACSSIAITSDVNSADDYIDLDSTDTSGETYVDAGTYNNVRVITDGTWSFSFTAAG